jgi:hypothetical protein
VASTNFFRREFAAPLERFCGLQRVDNDRVNPLIVFPQVMIGPVHRIVRDEFRRIALSRRNGKICEAAQVERGARIGEHDAETLDVAAGGKAIDNAWNTRCMRQLRFNSSVALSSSPQI